MRLPSDTGAGILLHDVCQAEFVGLDCRSVWFGRDVHDEPELKRFDSGLAPPVTHVARGPGPHSLRNHGDRDNGTEPLLKRFCLSDRTQGADCDNLGADSRSGTKIGSQVGQHSCEQHTRSVPFTDCLMSACNNFVKLDYQYNVECPLV